MFLYLVFNVFDILFVQFLCFTSLISAAVQVEKVSTKSRYDSAVSTARKAHLSQPQTIQPNMQVVLPESRNRNF